MVRAAAWKGGVTPPAVPAEVWRARFPLSDAELRDFCRRWKIRRLLLIGSVLREDFAADSDIDVLVEFEDGAHWPWGGYGEIRAELKGIVPEYAPSVSATPNPLESRLAKSMSEPLQKEALPSAASINPA